MTYNSKTSHEIVSSGENEMSKQRDDTPEEIDPSGEEETPGPAPGSYYYDDSTGYEVYDPEQEEEDYEDAETRGHGDAAKKSY
jgi:hypothetical protein